MLSAGLMVRRLHVHDVYIHLISPLLFPCQPAVFFVKYNSLVAELSLAFAQKGGKAFAEPLSLWFCDSVRMSLPESG